MKSDLLSNLGFDPAYIIIGICVLNLILFILLVVSLGKQKRLRRKLEKFMKGKDAESLEDILKERFIELDKLKLINMKHRKEIDDINNKLTTTFQKFGVVNYDAFKGMGRKMSFAFALLDQNNDGFIINAIHSNEGGYIYMKDIKKGSCKIDLSNEEQKALKNAMDS